MLKKIKRKKKMLSVILTCALLSGVGCATPAESESLSSISTEAEIAKETAKYTAGQFLLTSLKGEMAKDDNPLDFVEMYDGDGEKVDLIVQEYSDNKAYEYATDEYVVTVSYIKTTLSKDSSKMTVNFTVTVQDLTADTAKSGYVKQFIFNVNDDKETAKAETATSKSSSKSDTKTKSNTKSSSKSGSSAKSTETTATKSNSNSKKSDTGDNFTSTTTQSNNTTSSSTSNSSSNSSSSSSNTATVHEHSWTPVYATRTVQTGTVHHDAVYETQYYILTASGREFATIDEWSAWAKEVSNATVAKIYAGMSAEQAVAEAEPTNYSTESRQVLVSGAYDEPVYGEESYIDHYVCNGCGATK